MPTMQETKAKAGRVRLALEKEAARLNSGDKQDRHVSRTLCDVVAMAEDSTLARLFDLLNAHPTKAAALAALQEGGR